MNYLKGNEVFNNIKTQGQVYLATHDGVGNRLPYMNRSFISFTYGGKAIEDFGLIVTFDEKMEYNLYASFSDATSTYDTIDGQLYWGTRLEANQLSLKLSTDEITEEQLDEFKYWFCPGVERELILAEHPNRYIFARISERPVFSFLPFEKKIDMKINGISYETSTTLYKGSATLTFVMDDPYWHSKINYMPSYINKKTLEKLEIDSEDINKVEALKDKDMLKIMFEDRIPHQSILNQDMFLGGNILVSSEARVDFARVGEAYLGIITLSSPGLILDSETPRKLFYGGTAQSKPIIKFSMNLKTVDNYITNPRNKIYDKDLTEYSWIAIGDKKFDFTTSSILTNYNQVIQIFSSSSSFNKVELLQQIRNLINDYYVRAWAIHCIDKNTDKNSAIELMSTFFSNNKVTFIINSKTGEAIGEFTIKYKNDIGNIEDKVIKQNVGDMIRSDYLIIEGRDYLNENGEIEKCHEITTNEELTDVLIFYENMFL